MDLDFEETGLGNSNQSFNFKVWEGKIKKDFIKQTVTITKNRDAAFELSASIKELFTVSAEINNISEISLVMENPVEYILENPYPSIEYAGKKEFLEKPYIGSDLKVDKINLIVKTKDGVKISGDGVVKYLKPSANFKYDLSTKSVYFAENAFVGYKLSSSPKDAGSLTPFSLVYQFLHNESGSSGWKEINDRGVIKSGDALKIRVQTSHSCYLYIFNIDSKGNVGVLFPDKKLGYLNPINGNAKYNFPKDINQGFNVDTNSGIEEFLFMVFREDNPEMKKIVENAQSGSYKVDDFRNSNVVIKTKGVGGLKEVKVSPNETTPGFDFKTKKIQGLPTDFKETFLLDHK